MLSTAVTKAVLGRVPAIRRYQVLYRDLFTKEMADWPPDLRAALVERQHVEAGGQRGRDEVPPSRVRRAAMHQEHRRAALASVIDAVKFVFCGLEFPGLWMRHPEMPTLLPSSAAGATLCNTQVRVPRF